MEYINFSHRFFEFLGIAGFLLYVLNYTFLTFRILTGDSLIYFAINFCAASFVLAGLMNSFNLAAALVQIFWICMSTLAIVLRLVRRNPPVTLQRG